MQNKTVSREKWLALRRDLLAEEKAHTRRGDRLAQARQALPWVKLDQDYRFTGVQGEVNLLDLFAGQHQLLVYHLMFGATWDDPCDGCSAWADAFNGTTDQFSRADASLVAVSHAPFEMLAAEQQKRGWTFNWVSAAGTTAADDFNLDFYASTNDLEDTSRMVGEEEVFFGRGENHGISVFYRNDDDEIFHTYSCYNRGIEAMNGAVGYLDLLPKGRAW